jgi:hypothetical protein
MSTATVAGFPTPEILAPGDVSVDISFLSFRELDARIDTGLAFVAGNLESLRPYLEEMRERLHSQGKRTDLSDTPQGLPWTEWVRSKKDVLGSLRKVQYLLKGEKAPSGMSLRANAASSSEEEPEGTVAPSEHDHAGDPPVPAAASPPAVTSSEQRRIQEHLQSAHYQAILNMSRGKYMNAGYWMQMWHDLAAVANVPFADSPFEPFAVVAAELTLKEIEDYNIGGLAPEAASLGKMALDQLAQHEFVEFGRYAAIRVHLNQIAEEKTPNPFAPLVQLAKQMLNGEVRAEGADATGKE